MTLVSAFNESFWHNAGKAAIEFHGMKISFEQLDKTSNKVANALIRLGIKKGDRVAQFLENSIELPFFFLGALKAGAIVVPINTFYRDMELDHIINNSGASLILVDNERLKVIESCRHRLKSLKKIITPEDNPRYIPFSQLIKDAADLKPQVSIGAQDGAIIFYTSGTTGKSKGALLSHYNVESNLKSLKEAWRWKAGDRLFLALPLYHIHGLGVGLCGSLYNGASIVLRKKFIAEEALPLIQQHRCTMMMGVPTMYIKILETEDRKKCDISSIRVFISGSAPLSSETAKEFRETFGHEILERAGMSETMMNFSNPYDGPRKLGTVGKPLPGLQVRLVDKRFRDVPRGEAGDLLIRGPSVFKGYWNAPEKNNGSFYQGWFITGDIAKEDEDGHYSFVGRSRDMIISGGLKVFPREGEELIDKHPAVKESAVVGVPDKIFGESVKAYIVLKNGISIGVEDIQRHCKEHLASYKKPRYIEIVPDLPKTATGKVQKTVLQEMALKSTSQ